MRRLFCVRTLRASTGEARGQTGKLTSTMPLRAIVFDLWGTLMSERRDLFPERSRLRYEAIAPLLSRSGIHVTPEEFTERQRTANQEIGRLQDEGRDVSAEERARFILERFDREVAARATEADIAAFVEAYGAAFLATPPALLAGAGEAIEEARGRGLRVGLVSNTGIAAGRHIREVLDAHGLLSCFDSLVFSDEHGRSKPDPAIFEHSLADLDATPAEAVFVGDTPRFDVSPPRRYGWWVVQVGDRDDGDPPAHVRVPGLAEVFPALSGLGLLDFAASEAAP